MDLTQVVMKPKNDKGPRTLICYICGLEYGTHSLWHHLKTCQKKWDKDQAKLPKDKQKPRPQPPKGFLNMVRMAQGKRAIPGEDYGDLDVDL